MGEMAKKAEIEMIGGLLPAAFAGEKLLRRNNTGGV